jgi:hypothetical protein
MNPGIFLINDQDELVEMNEQGYDSEKRLQDWLSKHPSLLVGNQIDADEPRRWLFIEAECAVPSEEGGGGRRAIDHLFLDQDAIPTIVEVKRSTDTRIVAKLLAKCWTMPPMQPHTGPSLTCEKDSPQIATARISIQTRS